MKAENNDNVVCASAASGARFTKVVQNQNLLLFQKYTCKKIRFDVQQAGSDKIPQTYRTNCSNVGIFDATNRFTGNRQCT